ncbi:hypothetical protein HOF56_01380 [Candidatus Peribacteria bacterium]|jgi:hypothetical protein|nr:hypothetical protein [Candidatus Peribacteria bacterium]MBT4020814.1 hypothetical protein [Candidatus Peribacteria bacterium]MBT4241024.1 hypothetical protein [Candidatus Peribacteria bacterium]MBT4474478.1 hypothetical protein [Candidatus Peribacteria bacterium]
MSDVDSNLEADLLADAMQNLESFERMYGESDIWERFIRLIVYLSIKNYRDEINDTIRNMTDRRYGDGPDSEAQTRIVDRNPKIYYKRYIGIRMRELFDRVAERYERIDR